MPVTENVSANGRAAPRRRGVLRPLRRVPRRRQAAAVARVLPRVLRVPRHHAAQPAPRAGPGPGVAVDARGDASTASSRSASRRTTSRTCSATSSPTSASRRPPSRSCARRPTSRSCGPSRAGAPSRFVSGTYNDRIAIAAGRLHFREKICVLDSDVPPDSLVLPDLSRANPAPP